MKARRMLSLILAIAMILGVVPVGEIVAWAAEETSKKISVRTNYKEFNKKEEIILTIQGPKISKEEIKVLDADDNLVNPKAVEASGENIVQYKFDGNQSLDKIFVWGNNQPINESKIPKITGRIEGEKPAGDRFIDEEENMILVGDGIENLTMDLKIDAYFDGVKIDPDKDLGKNKNRIVKNVGKTLGSRSLKFVKETVSENGIPITIEHQYSPIVIVRGELIIDGKLTMFPTQGPEDTLVTITAENTIEQNVSVFFMKKGEEYTYTKKNMAQKVSGTPDKKNLSFRVPIEIDMGRYEIMVTNKIDPSKEIESQINVYKVLGNKVEGKFINLEFLLVDGNNRINTSKLRIDPSQGSVDGGYETTIKAENRNYTANIIKLSPELYEGGELETNNLEGVDGVKELVLTYKDGKYNDRPVDKIVRKIRVQIGTEVEINGFNTEGSSDELTVIIPRYESGDYEKDVILTIDTQITFKDDELEQGYTEGGIIGNKFTYDQIDYKPSIDTISPNKIQVEDGKVFVDKDNNDTGVIITIKSEKESFLKYGYKDEDGNINFKMPQISIDKVEGSDKWFKNSEIKVYKKNGEELKSKEGKQFGSTIKIKLIGGSEVGKGVYNLKVKNPLVSEEPGELGDSYDIGEIEFIEIESNKIPKIKEVVTKAGSSLDIGTKEALVPIKGEGGIKIKGTGFKGGVDSWTLKLDDEKVPIIDMKLDKDGGDDYIITFNAPQRPVGTYQIVLQHDDGRMAVFDKFSYIETSEDIKINEFNPKKGMAGTLVTVKGENFLRPNPQITNISGREIYKLIGTRVFLGDKEANYYNMENGSIILKAVETSDDLIKIKDGYLELSDDGYSLVLEEEIDGELSYYTIFSNTRTGEIEINGGDGSPYILKEEEGEIKSTVGGAKVDFTFEKDHMIIGGKTLSFKTPYEKKDGKIIGHNVKVIDGGELRFKVPPMAREGYYDLRLVNPDTKSDSRTGNNGFYYSGQADPVPKIEKIDPDTGSQEGGYYITISGTGFVDNGSNRKTSVTIGEIEISPKDVEVIDHGKTIKVKVPKYPGKLEEETNMDRKTVPVVVVNPNGGSDYIEKGFNYMVITSKPVIDKLILDKGSAEGGKIVTIEGHDFIFYEPYTDSNLNGRYDKGERFTDINKNGEWDDYRHWLNKENDERYNELLKDKDEYKKFVRPILPKVYFGKNQAKVIGFSKDTIKVETPKGINGPVDVYLVNNDYGRSNILTYNYAGLNPNITKVEPDTGDTKGRTKVKIFGKDFSESGVRVHFGDMKDIKMSNSSIGLDAPENSGEMKDEVSVELGDLTITYNVYQGDRKTLTFEAKSFKNGKSVLYGPVVKDYDDSEFFFNVEELENEEEGKYPGYEEVRVMHELVKGSRETTRLRVDRGFAPISETKFISEGQVEVNAPSYYKEVENVTLTLINADGAEATSNFKYKDIGLQPEIIDLRENGQPGYGPEDGRYILRIPSSGGNIVEVIGKNLQDLATLKLVPRKYKEGMSTEINIPVGNIKYDIDNEDGLERLIVEMPEIKNENDIDEEFQIFLKNDTGGSAWSEPRFIKFVRTGNLNITKVTPNFGPTAGGTTVTIEGEGFTSSVEGIDVDIEVYFGKENNRAKVNKEDIQVISYNKIIVKSPPYTAGLADVIIRNNSNSREATLTNAFNYVSNPRITSVVHPENESFVIETVSIEGGEKIKILGSDFMEGARVIFNPQLKLVEDDGQAVGDIITIDDRKYILESGVPGTEIERLDGQTITVTTPPGKLGDKGVIVINPDGGGTNIYNLVYGIPEIAAPFNVRAEVVFDQFIRVNWSGVSEALEYEIHMSIDGGKFEFIDTTELRSYAVQKLKPNTKYRFLVKAMGKYGTSKPIDESKSNQVTTGKEIGPIDVQGKPAEKTEIRKNGTKADIIVGSKDFTSKGMIIDLTKGDLASVKDISIRIPASVISDSTGKIQVLGKDYRMNFTPSVFKTSTIEANKSKTNAGVVFNIATHNDNIDLKGGESIVGGRYKLEAVTYVDKSLSKMDYINGSLNFILDQDPLIIKNRRLKNIKTVRYDDSSKTWVNINAENRLGLYTVIGSRR